MPYRTNTELPPDVRAHLPEQAQDIYRDTFNFAYAANAGDADRDTHAHMIALAQVKRSYAKEGQQWVKRGRSASS
jgi:cation transport regulator